MGTVNNSNSIIVYGIYIYPILVNNIKKKVTRLACAYGNNVRYMVQLTIKQNTYISNRQVRNSI